MTVVVGTGNDGSGKVGSVTVGGTTVGRVTVGTVMVGSGIDVVVGRCIAAAGDGRRPTVSHKPVTTTAKVKKAATRRRSRDVSVHQHPSNIGKPGENLKMA